MKTNIINQYRPQNTYQYQADRHVKYTSNNQSKIYPQDKICVSNELKRTVRTGDNQQVEFIYFSRNKRVTATVINKSGEKKQVRSEDLPKELKQISNPEKFKAFLRSAYTKVSTSSNGDYKLYVNQKGLGGMMSRSGSITPTTQAQVLTFSTISHQQEVEQLKEQLEQAKTQSNYLQVSNTALTLYEQEHIGNPNNVIFELHYQENINAQVEETLKEVKEEVKQEELQPQVSITQGGPLVKRFGINPEAVPGAVGYNITYDRLHYVEQEVFNLAIQELSNKSSAQELQSQQEYPHNVVVVDIFAREQGKIKTTQTGLPETHTVVLWKKIEQEIVLIDPNNTRFSQHIKEAYYKLTNTDISILNIENGVIYSTNSKPTGYSKYSEETVKPRDCIDIAVKIAFEINEQQLKFTQFQQIEKNVCSQISNNTPPNISLTKSLNTTFIRELQSTSHQIRSSTNTSLSQDRQDIETLAKSINLKIEDGNKSISFITLKTSLNIFKKFGKKK